MLDTPALQTIRRTTRPLDDDRPGQLGREIVGIGQVGRDHRPLLRVEAGRRGFRESEFVRRHWPESIREETDAWFGERRTAHRAFFGDSRPLVDRMPELFRLLTETQLETSALWLLGTNVDEVQCARLAEEAGSGDAEVAVLLGHEALSRRRFEMAADYYARAVEHPSDALRARMLQVFSLAMGGRFDVANRIAEEHLDSERSRGEARFVTFLQRTFGRGTPTISRPVESL